MTSKLENYDEAAWKEWADHGMVCEYIHVDRETKLITPAFGRAVDQIARGFCPRGTKVHFLNKNGYDGERERAAAALADHDVVTVKECRIGSSSSTYEFEEVEGKWNTVMFARLGEDRPFESPFDNKE